MNRRSILRLLGLAPVALPVAVKAAAASSPYASGGPISSDMVHGAVGEPAAGSFMTLDEARTEYSFTGLTPNWSTLEFSVGDEVTFNGERRLITAIYDATGTVEQQMVDHDLFDFRGEPT